MHPIMIEMHGRQLMEERIDTAAKWRRGRDLRRRRPLLRTLRVRFAVPRRERRTPALEPVECVACR